ncbi:MAG TPA: transposase, partial [Candidatus Angelobacter sp.]|nr:transposase [Candidatus Angelobacter sp.]
QSVETARSLMTVLRYIHQNPIKAGIVDHAEDWRWSSCLGYYNKTVYPRTLLDEKFILSLFSADATQAKEKFKEFNEKVSYDQCLDDNGYGKTRLTDEEARQEIKALLGSIEIAQVKGLPRLQRNDLLQKIKRIEGLSQRQVARILGVSPSLIYKA